MSSTNIPRTYMERLASLERRVAELERELRETRRPHVIPTSVRVVNPTPDIPWGPPPVVATPHTHIDEVRHGDRK